MNCNWFHLSGEGASPAVQAVSGIKITGKATLTNKMEGAPHITVKFRYIINQQ